MKEKYSMITGKLINDSFPRLRDKKIHLFVVRFRFYACSIWIPPFIRFIIMSTRTKALNEIAVTGILAHELCHQERYLEMSIPAYLRFVTGFILSRKARIAEEKATDRLTIEKGYGKQLHELSLIQHHDKNHESIKDNYLTPEEIKAYSENIGKW
jgi:hypothetical protein